VVINLGSSLFYRLSGNKTVHGVKPDFRYKKYSVYYRPGHEHFIDAMMKNDRIKFAFYSSMMMENIESVANDMYLKHQIQDKKPKIFDQSFCSMFKYNS
jgi:iron-sulfur cluster repair protein YtfE (RIC family)